MNRPVRVLVCSGNLGNALPTPESIAAWIPNDGCYSEVVDSSQYPIPSKKEQDELFKEIGLVTNDNESLNTTHQGCTDENQEDANNHKGSDQFDIIVIGMQEATFSIENEKGEIRKDLLPIVQPLLQKAQKSLQKTAKKGFATVTTLTASADHNKAKRDENLFDLAFDWNTKAKDSCVIQQLLADRCPSYEFAIRFQRGEMRLEILVHPNLEAKVLSVRAENTGLGGVGANKGGICGELLVGGSTRISFITAHLEAHEGLERYQNRCQMLTDIFSGTADESLSAVKYDMSLKSHHCFVLGDLNFRTDIDGKLEKEQHRALVDELVKEQNWKDLNKADELFRALHDKDVAVGFHTLPCYFPPTFKVLRESGYTYVDNRRPSYTDRIMWKSGDKLEEKLVPVAYQPIDNFTTSDHKPIRGAYLIDLNQHVKRREPRLVKRVSVLQGLMRLGVTRNLNQLPRQSLHIFISNLKCVLRKRKEYKQASSIRSPRAPSLQDIVKPDPFVAFISFPKQLVKEDATSWQKFGRYFAPLRTKTNEDGTATRTAAGWPRTKRLNITLEPDWSDEDVHLRVRSHDKDGVPLDHTGAILYFSVFNANSLDLAMIGTFPMNLAHLCATARSARRSGLRGRSSVYLKDDAMNTMTSFEISEPLCKNGKETGWITCDIDACWLDDNAASIKSAKTMEMTLREKRAAMQRSQSHY